MEPAGPAGGAPASAGAFYLHGDGGGELKGERPNPASRGEKRNTRMRSECFCFHIRWVVALLPR